MVDGISSTTDNSAVQFATERNDALDKDAFLRLMLAQLQNQDPLEPLDGTDYSAQLAQFSSLEQMTNINNTLNMSLDANYLLTQSINNSMTAALIGNEVKIAGNTVPYEGQDKVTIGYDLIANSHDVSVKIYDSNGRLVKTFDDLDTSMGEYKLSWDFTDNNGKTVSPGNYKVEIEATNNNLTEMKVPQYFVGPINAVRYSAEGTTLVVNGLEYDISEVFEVLGSTNSMASAEGDETAPNGFKDEN